MSFSSLEAGHATSGGAILYPFRELERDIQRELDAWQNRRGAAEGEAPAGPDEEFAGWLRSDDSPLLLHNVGEFVLDPEAHLRDLAARVEGAGRDRLPAGRELTGATARQRADEVRARARAFAELDAERVGGTPRRRGTPRGRTRTHYVFLVSPPRDLSNAEFKLIVLRVITRRWPGVVAAGYIHRDTDNVHLHLWMSAETISGKKIDVRRRAPSGDAVLDKYPDLDEEVARAFSRHFHDPAIYDDHTAKKIEWVHWRERFETALGRGEPPPPMPYRARHEFDWVGERRAVSDRERGEGLSPRGEKEKAAPVPRTKSLMGALELWGKTLHLEARVRLLRDLVEPSGPLQSPADVADLRKQLAEAERDHERHEKAYEKTLENRAREGLPGLKHPLHNTRQLEEMAEAAARLYDVRLLRRVHRYEMLGPPAGGRDLGQIFGEKWGAQIAAEAAARGELLRLRALLPAYDSVPADGGYYAGDTPRATRESRMRRLMVEDWAADRWSSEDMRRGLELLPGGELRQQAERCVRAREYAEAAREMLGDWHRAGGDAQRPVLTDDGRAAVERVLAGAGEPSDEGWRGRLGGTLDAARGRGPLRAEERESLLAESLPAPAKVVSPSAHPREASPESFETALPFDDQRFARLRDLATLVGTRALAAAMRGREEDTLEGLCAEARSLRDALELSAWARAGVGLTDAPGVRVPLQEKNDLDAQRRYVSQRLWGEPDWTRGQVETIREFALYAPEREREKLTEAVVEAERRLARADRERAAERQARAEQRIRELSDALDEGLNHVDGRYRDEFFRSLDLERDGGHDSVRRKERELAGRYAAEVKRIGMSPEEGAPKREEVLGRAYETVAGAIDLAERMRDTLHAALLDNPDTRLLEERLNEVGMTLRYRMSESRRVVGADLTYGDITVDTRSLGGRLDGRVIDERASNATSRQRGWEVEQTIRACMEVCLADEAGRGRILEEYRHTGGRLDWAQSEKLDRTLYAFLAREAVRSGAERDWEGVDRKILEMGAGPPDQEEREHYVRVRGVSKLVERAQNAQTARAVPAAREVQSPTRPEPERDGRVQQQRNRSSSRGGR